MSIHGLYLDINQGKKKDIYMPLEIYFYFLCLIKMSPRIIYLLHIKMLYFAFCESFCGGGKVGKLLPIPSSLEMVKLKTAAF